MSILSGCNEGGVGVQMCPLWVLISGGCILFGLNFEMVHGLS